MNRPITRLIIPAAALTMLAACNDISEDDRFILTDPVVPARVVLIEDFTGQNCVNCPDAHAVIENLEQQYPGAVVAVSIHAGDFGISKEYTNFSSNYIGLKTEEGQAYNDSWGIDSWPSGVVNRRGGASNYDTWSTAVRNELERPADVNIDLTATNVGGDIAINVSLAPQADINGYLQLWVIESGIVARQRSTSQGLIRDYVHNNVFRAPVNGLNGENISLSAGIHTSASYTIAIRDNEQERWVPERLSVVAFVADADGVHQAAIAPVLPPMGNIAE